MDGRGVGVVGQARQGWMGKGRQGLARSGRYGAARGGSPRRGRVRPGSV